MSVIFDNRPFGRTGEHVPRVWVDNNNDVASNGVSGIVYAGDWLVLSVGPDMLDRRGEDLLKAKLHSINRVKCDVVRVQNVLAGELKAGWPLHRLQRFRDTGLCRYVMIDTHDVLEAEWITSHAPVHAVGVDYSVSDMAVRYRVFDAAKSAGIALVACATTVEDFQLQMSTPDITAVIVSPQILSEYQKNNATYDEAIADQLWLSYQKKCPPPQPLRGAHPPEFGA
jgi:hypothetical protein